MPGSYPESSDSSNKCVKCKQLEILRCAPLTLQHQRAPVWEQRRGKPDLQSKRPHCTDTASCPVPESLDGLPCNFPSESLNRHPVLDMEVSGHVMGVPRSFIIHFPWIFHEIYTIHKSWGYPAVSYGNPHMSPMCRTWDLPLSGGPFLAAVDSTGALPSRRLKEHRTAARNMAVAADSIDVRTIANILHTYMRMYIYIYIISLSIYIPSLSLYIYRWFIYT